MAYEKIISLSTGALPSRVALQTIADYSLAPNRVHQSGGAGKFFLGASPYTVHDAEWITAIGPRPESWFVASSDTDINGASLAGYGFGNSRYIAVRYSDTSMTAPLPPLTLHIRKNTIPESQDVLDAEYLAYPVDQINQPTYAGSEAQARFYAEPDAEGNFRVQWTASTVEIFSANQPWDGAAFPEVPDLDSWCEVVSVPSLIVSGSLSLVTGNQNLAVVRVPFDERVTRYSQATLDEQVYDIQSITEVGLRGGWELVLVIQLDE